MALYDVDFHRISGYYYDFNIHNSYIEMFRAAKDKVYDIVDYYNLK